METTSKQPSEKYFIAADFSRVWTTGDTVDLGNSTIVAEDKDGSDKTADVLDGPTMAISTNGKGLKIRIKDGLEAESPYKITAKCITVGGDEWELDIEMVIFDE